MSDTTSADATQDEQAPAAVQPPGSEPVQLFIDNSVIGQEAAHG